MARPFILLILGCLVFAKEPSTPLPDFSDSTEIGGQDPILDSLILPWLGTQHKTGRQSKTGIDCSGFVQVILKEYLQYATARSSKENFKRGHPVAIHQLLPGDVIFFRKRGRIYHSGIWIGNGRFAHASTSKGVIVTMLEDDKYWKSHYTGARRFVENPKFSPTPTPDTPKDSLP